MSDQPRQLPEQDFSGKAYITDNRSPLRKLVGDKPIMHDTVEFPGSGNRFGSDSRVGIVAIPVGGRLAALGEAYKFLTGPMGNPAEFLSYGNGAAMLNTESQVQLLARTLRDPSDPSKPFAADVAELRQLLDADECDYLFDRVLQWDAQRSNFAKMPSLKEAEELFDALGKGIASRTSLKRYDAISLRSMITALAVQHSKRTQTRSSGTGPQSDSSA